MPASVRALPLRHALVLGLLHGPAELLPVSSSAHTTLVPWLAGWPYDQLDPRLRKSFEVALHAGTAAALLLRTPSGDLPRDSNMLTTTDSEHSARTRFGFLIAALTPPALVGYTLGSQIERRLGTPTKIVYGLLAGSAAMGGVEVYKKFHAPCARGGHRYFEGDNLQAQPVSPDPNERDATAPVKQTAAMRASERKVGSRRLVASANARDGLALGLAQALALIPGVSRNGATLTAARARGFSRRDADQLSWMVGLPVIVGATLLQGTRLARRQARADRPTGTALPMIVGAASSFLSTLAGLKALDQPRRAQLLPACIAYRGVLAAHVIRRMRDNT
jgi:undecaprenyl-diphosphatase